MRFQARIIKAEHGVDRVGERERRYKVIVDISAACSFRGREDYSSNELGPLQSVKFPGDMFQSPPMIHGASRDAKMKATDSKISRLS